MPTAVVCLYLNRRGDPRSPYLYCNRRASQVRPGEAGCSYGHCRTFRAICEKAAIASPDCDPVPIPPAPPADQEPPAMPAAHNDQEPTAPPAPPDNAGATTTPPAAPSPEPVIPEPTAGNRGNIAWRGPVRDTVRDVDEDTPLIGWAQEQIAAGASALSVCRRIGCSDSALNWQIKKAGRGATPGKSKPAGRKQRTLAPLPPSGPSAPAGEQPPSEPTPDPVPAGVEPFGDDPTPRRCRVCGCTDDHACPGGCSWVAPDLCSACAGVTGVPVEQPLRPTRELRDALERAGLLPRSEAELRELVADIPEEVLRAYIIESDLAEELAQFHAGWRRCLEHLRIGPDLVALRDALTASAGQTA